MTDFSFIANAHPSYIENLYEQYQTDPQAVDSSWAAFFKGFQFAQESNSNGAVHTTGGSTSDAQLTKELRLLSCLRVRITIPHKY